jgi:hypothetical protein
MENDYSRRYFVALAREEWKTKKNGNYETRDLEEKGKVVFKIFHAREKGVQDLSDIGTLSLDVFPSTHRRSCQSITVPDYLAAVSGHLLCVVYLKEKNERVLDLYDINEHTKTLALHSSCVLNNALPPTAIIAIKEKVFLGFPGRVGFVDLLEPKLSVNMFHEWQEQTWGRDTAFLKTIDAFAYDSNSPSKTLLAIDDVTWPKYVFAYDLHHHPPKFIAKYSLPEMVSGPNEHCTFADKCGDVFVVTTESHHQGGSGTGVIIGDVKGGQLRSILEMNPWEDSQLPLELLAGDKWSEFNSVALLNEDLVLIGAGHRGIIAFTVSSIKEAKIKIPDDDEDLWMDVKKPAFVRSLNGGTITQQVVAVKHQSFAFVLSTEEAQKNQSVLSQVVWNNDKSELQVVKSHHIDGQFSRLFVEM